MGPHGTGADADTRGPRAGRPASTSVRWAGALALAPAPGAWRTAVRAGATVLAALLVLDALGEVDRAAFATFGAFASVYGGPAARRGRWRIQVALGVVLVAAAGSGAVVAVSDHRVWLSVAVAPLWAAAAAVASDRFSWRPPGPLFPVFAFTTCAAIPGSAGGLAVSVMTALAAAALAIALGVAEEHLAPARTTGPPAPMPTQAPTHPAHRRRIQALRCLVAVAVAGAAARLLDLEHPSWAMVACVVPLTATGLSHQLLRGVHRVAGTAAGLLVAWPLLELSLPTAAVLVLVALLQSGTELLVTRNYGLALVLVTPLALLLGQVADPSPVGELLASRLAETLLGVAVGVTAAGLTRERVAR